MTYLVHPRNPAPPASLTSRLIMLLAVKPDIKAFVLTPMQRAQLLKEMPAILYFPVVGPSEDRFCGVPIRRRALSLFCCNCGAPTEPKTCSYCRTANDEIVMED